MFYNIALIPHDPTPYSILAQALFSKMSDSYLLSSDVHPHITICQFFSNETATVTQLWNEIKGSIVKAIEPQFIGMNFIKGQNEHKDFYWAQIGVERDSHIMKTHNQTLNLLKKYGLHCLNDTEDIYKPHLTLARIKLNHPIPWWPTDILASQQFKLSIAEGDRYGRYLKTLYQE